MAQKIEVSCKNVFKNGDKKVVQKAYSRKWIELINQLEKGREQRFVSPQ